MLAKITLIGANTELVTPPAMEVQERLDEERILFRRATVRASNTCDHAQQVTEEKARFMSESNEEVCSIPNQAQIIRGFVNLERGIQGISGQRKVAESRVNTDGDHAERVIKRKSTIAVESWMQDTQRPSVAEPEFHKEVQSPLILLGAISTMMIDFGMLASVFAQTAVQSGSREETF